MRVIAGKYKGKSLFPPKDDAVRPTTDRIKENIFNLIQWRVPNSKFLDLFGGSGAIGIEAMSRGARNVIIVDAERESINLIKKNMQKVGVGKEGEVMFCDYSVALDRLTNSKFDIVFLDPPYAAEFYDVLIEKIVKNNIVSEDGIVIFEHDAERPLANNGAMQIVDERKYGKTLISIMQLSK